MDTKDNVMPTKWHDELSASYEILKRRLDAFDDMLAALHDIANGNVPPGFLNAALASPNFHESMAKWCQDRAKAAIRRAEGAEP